MSENLHMYSSEVWDEKAISPAEIKRDMHICITVAVEGTPTPKPTCGTVIKAEKNSNAVIVAIEIEPNAPRVFTLLDHPPAGQTYTVVERTIKPVK